MQSILIYLLGYSYTYTGVICLNILLYTYVENEEKNDEKLIFQECQTRITISAMFENCTFKIWIIEIKRYQLGHSHCILWYRMDTNVLSSKCNHYKAIVYHRLQSIFALLSTMLFYTCAPQIKRNFIDTQHLFFESSSLYQ